MGKSLDYLEQLERPEKWISLCKCCHTRLVEALGARKKIVRLQLQLENRQRQILRVIKGKGKTWKVDSTRYPEKQGQVVDLIKKYVHSRKYSILNSDDDDDLDEGVEEQMHPETRRSHSFVAHSPDPLGDEDLSDHIGIGGSLSPIAPPNALSTSHSRSVSPTEVKIISTKKTGVEAGIENGDGSRVVQRRRLRSKAWRFFDPTVAREVAKCKLCNATLKTNNGSTTALHRHLMGLHRKQFKALQKKGRRKKKPPLVIVSKPLIAKVKQKKLFPGQRKTTSTSIFSLPVPCKSKSYRYRYDCPNCPKVKGYPMAQFAMHLAIHLRRPFQCTICSDFLPVDEDIQENHWTEKHSDIAQSSNTDRFIRIKLDPGKIWKCEACEEGFFSQEDRDKHELGCLRLAYLERRKSLSLAERQPHQCQLCQLRFRNIAEWRLHRVLNHHQIDSMSCYYCDKSFREMTVDGVEARHEQKLADHMNGEHGAMRVYDECESCGLVFDTRIEKKEHFQERHGLPESMLYSCGVCGNANYSLVSGLRRHLTNTHFQSESSICDVCGTKFLHQRSLLHHKFQTHGILPEGYEVLTCPQEGCGFKSILEENVRKHNWMVHMAPKFLCKYCGRAFKLKCNLKGHMELHLNKDTKPYQCEVCGVSYAVKNYLSVHKRLAHEGKREGVKKRYVYRRITGQSTEIAATSGGLTSSSASTYTDL